MKHRFSVAVSNNKTLQFSFHVKSQLPTESEEQILKATNQEAQSSQNSPTLPPIQVASPATKEVSDQFNVDEKMIYILSILTMI